jgi:hypothetical protein
MILYPVGVFGEIRSIEEKITMWKDLSFYNIQGVSWGVALRVLQGTIVVGFIYLYLLMLKMRSKYYSKDSENRPKNN